MALYLRIFIIQIALIYPGICLHYNQNPDLLLENSGGEILPTLIARGGFILQWNQTDFGGENGPFIVSVTANCNVTNHSCPDVKPCIFNTNNPSSDCVLANDGIAPCDIITVNVTRGHSTSTISFNLAPNINNAAFVPQLTLIGNKATISWNGPASSDANKCATRARVALKVGNDWLNSTAMSVSLGASNTYDFDALTSCQHGKLSAKVIYLTLGGDGYDTDRVFVSENNINVPGVGLTSQHVEVLAESCSINVSWEVGCPGTDHYTVDWGGAPVDVTSTAYTIQGLHSGSYTVTVQAYWSDTEKQGDEITSYEKVIPAKAPDAPAANVVDTGDDPTRLTVSWMEPTTPSCAGTITGYTITYRVAGDTTAITAQANPSSSSYELTDLKPCTDYMVSVAADWSGGIGEADTNNGKTGIQVPGKSTNVKSKSITPYSLEVEWGKPLDNPCDITKYIVKWTNNNGGEGENETVSESCKITGLNACTNYDIDVTAYTSKGPGDPSDTLTLMTETDSPPVDEVIITAESRQANVTWKRPVTLCNLTYEVDHNGTTLWTYNQTTDSGKPQNITDPNVSADLDHLLPYTNYTICVSIVTGGTTCNTSITEEEVPSAPRDVAVINSSITDVSLILTWQYSVEENGILENYVVSRSMSGRSSTNFTVKANVTSYKMTGLNEGNYTFTISVNNSKGFSVPSKPIYCWINGPSQPGCDGGCIAGIVVGIMLVALAVPAFIFRERIINKFNKIRNPYELTGAAVFKNNFKKHVEAMEVDSVTAFQKLTDDSAKKDNIAALRSFNRDKNRDPNICPFDETRVKLSNTGTRGSDYINASHITFPETSDLRFIATQGPLKNTICDFWRMIWEHNVYDVVMLCNILETGESKCAQYWTGSGEKAMEVGEFKIFCHSEEEDKSIKCVTRYMEITKNDQRRILKQHHYLAWPYHGVPHYEDDMLNFLVSVKGKASVHSKNIVVHDSAGVGPTGIFIGLWVLTRILEDKRTAQSIDVHKVVLMMRECRPEMVQTKDQYLYLHKCIRKYIEDNQDQLYDIKKVKKEPMYGNLGVANMGYQN